MIKFPRIVVKSNFLILGLIIYFGLFLNKQLSIKLNYIINTFFAQNLNFKISVWSVIFIMQGFVLNLCLWGKWIKYTATILILLTALADHYCYMYGVHFDREMIKNVCSSNWLEANELINAKVVWHLIKFSCLPIAVISWIKIKNTTWSRELWERSKILGLSILIIICLFLAQSKNFYLLFRKHRNIRDIILPSSYLLSSARILFGQVQQLPEKPRSNLDLTATRNKAIKRKARLVVFVVGETVRAHNWGLSGYIRQTTPKLAKLPVINFPYAVSCGTNTNVSLPCMFSMFGRKAYSADKVIATGSVLHLLDRVKVKVTWIDNQSGCKGVCEDLPYYPGKVFDQQGKFCKKFENCFDEVLILGLKQNILKNPEDQLIILHQLGNHGPAYHARSPAGFAHFKPICQNANLAECDRQALINGYDNAILYTDHILAEIIKILAKVEKREVFLIYVSDHGESLGEGGLYLHGLPYKLAPEYQTKVPMIFWHGKNFPVKQACLTAKAKVPADHDQLYHTLLGLFSISSKTYDQNYDLLKDCYS